MTKLCPRGKAAAKRKFKVYPSAYANAYASKICAGKAKDPSGVKRKDWGPKKAFLGGMMKTKDSKKQEIENKENIFKKRKQDQKTKKQRLEEMRKELGMKKGGESKKKKMPKARDMAMGNKNIVYLGDPFIVDGKKFDPAKKFPKTYMRPEGAKTYSKGGYTGSHIKSEIGGKKVSNKSYEDYYKDLL